MILLNLLERADENKIFIVYNTKNEEIARYDGRDSIPEELNTCTVLYHLVDSEAEKAIIEV